MRDTAKIRTKGDCQTPARTQKRLIEAGLVVFAEHGFAGASTGQICRRAKSNRASVCYHFSDKLGLYEAVVVRSALELSRRWAEELSEGSDEQNLRVFVRQMMAYTFEPADLNLRIFYHEVIAPTAAGASMELLIQSRVELLCRIVAGIIGGSAESARTRMVATSVMAQITFFFRAKPALQSLWRGLNGKLAKAGCVSGYVEEFCLRAMADKSGSRVAEAGYWQRLGEE